jgi:hypothetical protein
VKKLSLAFVAAVLAAVSFIGLTANVASAHTSNIVSSCDDGLSVSLASYNGNANHSNTVTVTFDGSVVASNNNFGSSFSYIKANPDKTVAHTYNVTVTAWDDSKYNVDQDGTIPACEEPPPTTTVPPTTTTTPPTTPPVTPPAVVPPAPVIAAAKFTG